MSIEVRKKLLDVSKYPIKCPYDMDAEYITIHNTANDASAENEIAYMIRNNYEISFHYAIDDKEVVQGIPTNRNAWHCGDGGEGIGNRKSIGIEICYSESGGDKYSKAEELSVKFISQLLKNLGWGIDRVKKHQDWSGKYCPHRILSENRWDSFLKSIESELSKTSTQLYRVRKEWVDATSQIGAFSNLQNAINLVDLKVGEGYKVFNDSGKVVYTPIAEESKPQNQTIPANPHENHNAIKGVSVISADKMVAFVKEKNTNALNIEAIAKAFLEVGEKYGVRGDIALCQSIIETGWFKFDGGTAVKPSQHNYCGLGVTRKGLTGHSFDSVEEGVTAQIQHLFAYACKDSIPNGEFIIDPRFKYVTRGVAPHWEDLSGRWAMNPNYGIHILSIFEQLEKFEYIQTKAKVKEETVDYPVKETPIIEEVSVEEKQKIEEQKSEKPTIKESIYKAIKIIRQFFLKLFDKL